jgi:hypothetical protein
MSDTFQVHFFLYAIGVIYQSPGLARLCEPTLGAKARKRTLKGFHHGVVEQAFPSLRLDTTPSGLINVCLSTQGSSEASQPWALINNAVGVKD